MDGVACFSWKDEGRTIGRAIEAWHRDATPAADLADLRNAVRNMLDEIGGIEGR